MSTSSSKSVRPKSAFRPGRISLYWWCQLLGWGAVIPYWYYYEPKVNGYFVPILLLTAQAGSQIFATDCYRRLAHRFGWTQLTLPRLPPLILLAWFALTFQYLLMTVVVFKVRYGCCLDSDVLLGALAGGMRYHAIWLLAFHLYHFARQSSRAAAESARHLQLAAEARMAKLTSELNPHFLFNCLNGIRALTREDPARSREAIDRLAALLRYSLRHGESQLVPLPEEIAIVTDYLELEKMRLEERLRVSWEIPATADPLFLPPLSLHTLVENAVKHGIAPRPGGGTIAIRLTISKNHCQITVTNDGPYLPTAGSGTGLANLRQRLELIYNGRATLTVSAPPSGDQNCTRAELLIPRLP